MAKPVAQSPCLRHSGVGPLTHAHRCENRTENRRFSVHIK